MNKIYRFVLLLMVGIESLAAAAQGTSYPDSINAYYRLSNPDQNLYFTAYSQGSLGATMVSPTDASQVIEIRSSKMYNLLDDMTALQEQLNRGEIDATTYSKLFQQLMTLNSWKSGFYPLKSFRIQGTDYALYFSKLKDYCDSAITRFLNDEVPEIYTNNYQTLLMLSVFSGVIYPSNLATVDDFRAWCKSYLTQWRDITDFHLYLHPLMMTSEDGQNTYFSGNYSIEYKTPAWIGNMKKAQSYINAILTNNGSVTNVDTLDIWQSACERILAEVAKDYPIGSEMYNLVDYFYNYTQADNIYALCTDENGDMYPQPLPDAFGTNGVSLTAEQTQRIIWKPEEVNDASPFAVAPQSSLKGDDGYYYTTLCTDFAYKVLSPDVQVYSVSAVDGTTGAATLHEIADGKIPARTAVVVRSKSTDLADNQLVPLDEEVAPLEGNVLEGTLFAQQNNGQMKTLSLTNGQPAFLALPTSVAANTAYYTGKVSDGIRSLRVDNKQTDIFDLQGRRVVRPAQKGIYIINGKKVVLR